MNQKLIFLPLLAQVLLTAIVSLRLIRARVSEMRLKRIHPQKIATSLSASQLLSDSSKISDNFTNQFETPVVFYALVITLYATQMVDVIFIILASAFVVTRYIHYYIHCGNNKVMHRFYIFIIGTSLLWVTWVLFAIELLINM